jgi:hypothetical protein
VPAVNTRLHYVALTAKIAGYYVEGQELTVDDLGRAFESRSNEQLDYSLVFCSGARQ